MSADGVVRPAVSAPRVIVRGATDADRPAWDAFVASRPEGDPLQAWAWGELTAGSGERPHRVVAVRPDGRPAGLAQALVRATGAGRSVAYVPHGPLWEREAPDAEAILTALLDGLRQAGRDERAIVVKLDPRSARPGDDDALRAALRRSGLRPARHDLQARTTRIVDLTGGTEAMWARWESDARNGVRRAAKEGVTTLVDRAGDPAALAVLTELHAQTAQRAAFRGRPAAFLADAARSFAPSGGWYAVQAVLDGRPIAAMGLLRVGDRGFYLWGGSLRDTSLGGARGSYAALAAAIEALATDGCRTLDMWGVVDAADEASDPGAAGYSRFKRKFGGAPLRHPGTFDLVVAPGWYLLRDLRERLRGG
ncbi:MAG: FemAB family protein [Chloroflexi bacterium CSP1-4]|nr:MAG: FemAB family protein [Chloroflexi bacterium CSP1-4]